MTERNIAAEVHDGLREILEFRTGRRTLRTVRVELRPLPDLTPDAIRDQCASTVEWTTHGQHHDPQS